jgi:hypothetical protein
MNQNKCAKQLELLILIIEDIPKPKKYCEKIILYGIWGSG